MLDIRNFIGGQFVRGSDGKAFEKRSPLNNGVIATVSEASRGDVDRAVTSARSALKGPWRKLTTSDRVDLLYKVADEMTRRADDFVAAEIADTGMPRNVAEHMCARGAANFKIFADVIKNVPSEFFEMATPDGRGAINYALRRPVGVVGVICPWNAPLLLMTWKVGPALACGNAVVVKPSEETPQTAALLGEVMNSVGVPAGVYNVVNGFGPASTGEFLTTHPGVSAITFTGETRTGAAIMKAAADGARPVSLEMGGKNPAIVFADADLDAAIEGTMRSAFMNTGQVCLGTERVYVERPLFDRFVSTLKTAVEKSSHRTAKRSRVPHGSADLAGAPAKGAFVLCEGGGIRRQGRDRRRRSGDARRPRQGRLGAADDLDRSPGRRSGLHGGDLRPLLPCLPVRCGGRSRRSGQRDELRTVGRRLDPRSRPEHTAYRPNSTSASCG